MSAWSRIHWHYVCLVNKYTDTLSAYSQQIHSLHRHHVTQSKRKIRVAFKIIFLDIHHLFLQAHEKFLNHTSRGGVFKIWGVESNKVFPTNCPAAPAGEELTPLDSSAPWMVQKPRLRGVRDWSTVTHSQNWFHLGAHVSRGPGRYLPFFFSASFMLCLPYT